MSVNIDQKNGNAAARLRQQAEGQLKSSMPETQHIPKTLAESQRLLHELQVHEIELEMQNEELRQARNELDEALQRYTLLYDFAPVGYVSLDSTGIIRSVNLRATVLLGVERSQLLNRNFAFFVTSEDRQRFMVFLGEAINGNRKDCCEVKLVTKSSMPLFVQLEADSFGDGRECRLAVIDISLRKQAEGARLKIETLNRKTLQALPAHIAVIDRQGGIVVVNHAWTEFALNNEAVGKTLVTEGMNYLDVVRRSIDCNDTGAAQVLTGIESVLDGSSEQYSIEYPCHSPQKQQWFLMTVVALGPEDNDGAVISHLNITDKILTEEQLKKANSELELRVAERTSELAETVESLLVEIKDRENAEQLLVQQNRLAAMGEMVNNIAHQWRQPLNSLGLAIQQLPLFYDSPKFNRGFLTEKTDKAMSLIQYMSRTIDDFRNFFRSDKEMKSFAIKQVIEHAVALVQDSCSDKEISIKIRIDGDIKVKVFYNEYAQVLVNILSNARNKFEEQNVKNPLVTIHAFEEGNRSVVTITDNAGGIDNEIIEKIFEPYFTTKGPDKGTGIGLFMSKIIIENNMSGRLTVRNSGKGAEFRIEVENTDD